ncbi:MAG: hypothetical protein ACM3S0_16665 [Acidobacteriota bacterium]
MIVYLLSALVPAMLIVAVGVYIRSKVSAQDMPARWLQFLFLTTVLSLCFTMLLSNARIDVPFLVMPAATGLLAAFLLSLADRRFWSLQHFKASLFYALVIGILLVIFAAVKYSDFFNYLVFPALALALTWKAWEWGGLLRLLVLLYLLTIIVIESDVIPSSLSVDWPPSFQTIYDIVGAFWPVAIVGVAAGLVRSILGVDRTIEWWKVGLGLVLAGFLLLTVVRQILLALPWDFMMDGSTGVGISVTTSFAAIAAAMLLAWSLSGWRRWVAPGFALVVLIGMTYASDALAQVSPVTLTEERAEQVHQAILRYHGENGAYPLALIDLSPRYLWRIPEPIMLRGATWCYEGGSDHFRLGYLFHGGFGAPASVRIQGAAGTPPNPQWKCERDVANYNLMQYCGYTMNRTGCVPRRQ